MHVARGSKTERICKRCKSPFMARTADVKRGWAKFCSKSCKAVVQEKRTGQYKRKLDLQIERENNFLGSGVDKETWIAYQNEYGGTPCFNRKGEYEGFMPEPFDNTEHQNSGD